MTTAALAVIRESALLHNLKTIREHAAGAAVMAVVKADAYGHGLVSVGRSLERAGVDALAVARLSEGLRLRDAGVGSRVVVLEGCLSAEEARTAAELKLDLVVHDPSQLPMLEDLPAEPAVRVWLKLDTGMSRLGFPPGDVIELLERLAACPAVAEPPAVMTHLASADETDNGSAGEQIARFGDLFAHFPGDISIANSAALLAWPESLSDASNGRNWVRAGLALYGASPFTDRSAEDLGLKPVMTYQSRLIAVRDIAAGDQVGYGGTWTAQRPTRLGVVAAGYADGYPRHLPTGTPVLVGGVRAPVIGRVSMDMLTVDLTDSGGHVGDTVVLWGEGLPVEDIAERAGTIPWELLCRLSARSERRWDD